MNQIINLIIRLFGRQLMNGAMKAMMKTGGSAGQRQASAGMKTAMKNSQKAMKILRRLR